MLSGKDLLDTLTVTISGKISGYEVPPSLRDIMAQQAAETGGSER